MEFCDTDKGVQCYSFFASGSVQIIITTYFSILCLKALQVQALTASTFPLVSRIHLLKVTTILAIMIVEVVGLVLMLQDSDDDFIDGSQLFYAIVTIVSEFVCLILLRREFTTLKFTSGYLRSYIFLSLIVFSTATLINAFNNKSTSFGLQSEQIVFILCLILKFLLTMEVFIFKKDLMKNSKNKGLDEEENEIYHTLEEEGNANNDDLYFNLQDQHVDIDATPDRQKASNNELQIVYSEDVQKEQYVGGAHIYHSQQNNQYLVAGCQPNQTQHHQQTIRSSGLRQRNQLSQIDRQEESKHQHIYPHSSSTLNAPSSTLVKGKQTNQPIRTSQLVQDLNNNHGNGTSLIRDSSGNYQTGSVNSGSIPSMQLYSHNHNNFGKSSQLLGGANGEQTSINHVYIDDIYASTDGLVKMKIKIRYITGQSGELKRSLKEFQQIAGFIRSFYKYEDQDLMEIEGADLDLRFNNVQEEEAFKKKLEKAMNIIIINHFHSNANIGDFFRQKSFTPSDYSNQCNQYEESVYSSLSNNKGITDKGDNTDNITMTSKNSGEFFRLKSNTVENKSNQKTTSCLDRESNLEQEQARAENEDFSDENNQSNDEYHDSLQLSINIKSVDNSFDKGQKKENNFLDVIIKVKSINTEYIDQEDYTYFTNTGVKDLKMETRYRDILTIHNQIKESLPSFEIPELPFKEKTLDYFKSKKDQDVIDFRKKTLPSYFETILNNKQIQKLDFIQNTFFLQIKQNKQ